MKRYLAITFGFLLLSTFFGGAPAAARPATGMSFGYMFALSPPTGYVNSKVVVTNILFAANTSVKVTFDGAAACTFTTASNGTGSCSFRVPATDQGLHEVKATGGGQSNSKYFNVDPRVKLTPNYGPRGTTMNVSLRGFMTNTAVIVKWYNSTQKITIRTLTTSSTGSANFYFMVPSNAVKGPYKVWARQYNGMSTAATFTVT
ncbi:MAG: hypothetical protein ACJ789_06475 [Thermomicrobiales bacterium]